jgi:septal ring factor EnvC (AmiA/AmiB activator)
VNERIIVNLQTENKQLCKANRKLTAELAQNKSAVKTLQAENKRLTAKLADVKDNRTRLTFRVEQLEYLSRQLRAALNRWFEDALTANPPPAFYFRRKNKSNSVTNTIIS